MIFHPNWANAHKTKRERNMYKGNYSGMKVIGTLLVVAMAMLLPELGIGIWIITAIIIMAIWIQ